MFNTIERKRREKILEERILTQLIDQIQSAETPDEIQLSMRLFNQWLDMKKSKPRWIPSADTMIVVAANLIGILAIIHHEQVGVITSKALSFVVRGRV